MRVAINAVFLSPPMGGVETYVRQLVSGLLALDDPPEVVVLANPDGYEGLRGEAWAAPDRLVRCARIGRPGARMLGELVAVGAVADRLGADVVHSVAMTGPLWSRCARVVTIPDTVWITHPEATLTHRLWRAAVPRVADRAARVIAISHSAAEEVCRELAVDRSRLDVVPLGFGTPAEVASVDGTTLRTRFGLGDGPVILNVGQKKPHRNLERLVEAFASLARADARLVLPGPPNAAAEDALRAQARRLDVGGQVVIPGFVAPDELEGLYALADAFVLPSMVEGFGLPVLEAMARGVPVACSAASAPAEVAGDAALLFDPGSVPEIARAMSRLLDDPALAAGLRRAGPQRAAEFTWARCADETRASYVRALGAVGR